MEKISAAAHRCRSALPWLPIPALALTIAGLWVADLRTVYESRALMVLLNLFFSWLASLCICLLTARGFLGSGQPGLLMFGCGALLWGSTSLAAAAMVDNVNATITVHNLGVFGAAICHFVGLLWRGRLPRPGPWLAVGYAGGLLATALLVWAATAGWTPLFFVQGQGGTLVRQVVLLVAITLFGGVAWQLLYKFRGQAGAFYYWYGLGLALVATGLTGVLLLTVQGGLLGWTNRLTQYLGSAYLFIAALAAVRATDAAQLSIPAAEDAQRDSGRRPIFQYQPLRRLPLRYAGAVAAVALAFGLRQALTAWAGPGLAPYVTFYPVIMLVALLAGFGPGLLATALAGLAAAYWILPPYGTFFIAAPVDRLGLLLFIGTSLFMTTLATLYRRTQSKAAAYDREVALRASQTERAFLASVLDQASQPFAVGYPDGRLGLFNRAFEQLTGYSAAELQAIRSSAVLTPPEWRELDNHMLDELQRTGEPVRYEKEYLRKDGTRVPIELLVHLVRGTAGRPEYCYSFLADISARKQAEEQARQLHAVVAQEKERLTALVHSIADEIWFADRDGHFTLINPAGSREFALNAAVETDVRQLAGSLEVRRPDGTARPLEEAPPLRALLGEVVRNQEELVRTPATGELRYRQVSASPVKDAAGQIIGSVSVVRDVTDLKRAEQALQTSEARYSKLFNTMVEGFALHQIVTDGQGRPCDYIFLEVNPAFEQMTGLKRAALLGKRVREVLPRTESRWIEEYGRVALTGAALHMENYAAELDSWFEVFAYRTAPGQFAVVFSNITARKRAEAALRHSGELLRLVLQASAMGTFVVDLRTGAGQWNEVEFALLGLKPGDVPSTPDVFFRYVHPEDVALVKSHWEAAMQSGTLDVEFRIVRADGQERWLAGKGRFVADGAAGRQPARFLGVNFDITDRKRVEADLRAQMAQVQELNDELRRFNNAAVGRELRLIELKQEINAHLAAGGQPPRYKVEFDDV